MAINVHINVSFYAKMDLAQFGVLCKNRTPPSKQKIFISYSVYLAYIFCENILEKILL